MQRSFIGTLIIAIALLAGSTAYAQELGVEPLTFSISPEYPRPFQTVVVTPASTLIDLSASTVTITANGTTVARGSGVQKANITLGAAGTRTTIGVFVTAPDGRTYRSELTVRPAEVSLVLEPLTTVHPFYKGGSLVASEGSLRLIAIADLRTAAGSRIPPENLVYNWKFGDQQLQSQSGIGKSTLTAIAPVRYRDATVSLTVTSQDSSVVAFASVNVSPVDPFVRIYPSDPLLGPLFERALSGSFSMTEDEQTFRAVPYFFASAPAITWKVGTAAGGGDKDITLRSSGQGSGSTAISVDAKQPTSKQSANTRLTVQFDRSSGIGIFGL